MQQAEGGVKVHVLKAECFLSSPTTKQSQSRIQLHRLYPVNKPNGATSPEVCVMVNKRDLLRA